jgi:hypothetical protein
LDLRFVGSNPTSDAENLKKVFMHIENGGNEFQFNHFDCEEDFEGAIDLIPKNNGEWGINSIIVEIVKKDKVGNLYIIEAYGAKNLFLEFCKKKAEFYSSLSKL